MEPPESVGSIPASMGLQNLQSEPMRLTAEAERLNDELDTLVMDNFRVFVENLTCSGVLRGEDKKLRDYSSDLGDDLQQLLDLCGSFRDRVNQYITAHKRNRKTLKHNMQLVELLEIPQLVDACSRNGFHDEALELALFVNGLERKHIFASEVRDHSDGTPRQSGGNSVVQSIVNDVHTTLSDLRRQLLVRLSVESSLPKLLQVLSALRKLDGILADRQLSLERQNGFYTPSLTDQQAEEVRAGLMRRIETSLQMSFLEARGVWVESMLQGVQDEATGTYSTATHQSDSTTLGPYGRGIEILEVYRSSWFAVVTQFNALFGSADGGEVSPSSLLSRWIESQLNSLVKELEVILKDIDEGQSVRSLLEQSFLFASRMSEVGCDFRSHILPVFESAVVCRVEDIWRKGLDIFKQMVVTEKYAVDGNADELPREQVIPLYLRQDTEDSSASDNAGADSDSHPPPQGLIGFPPLAYLMNTHLVGLNFLRDCPLASVEGRVREALDLLLSDTCKFLVSVSDDIRRSGRKYISADSSSSGLLTADSMDRLYAEAITKDLIQHSLWCFQSVYTNVTLPSKSGATPPLDPSLLKISEHCRRIFEKADLVKASQAIPSKKPVLAVPSTSDVAKTEELSSEKNSVKQENANKLVSKESGEDKNMESESRESRHDLTDSNVI
mmetsp:Transcript_10004/g.15110  ORF Transcript_10004/g.15110 Transcript_10004/m.15110 type:complete len:671 (+) Transcript_10004:72-2084(+)